jgi:hypothetical protein
MITSPTSSPTTSLLTPVKTKCKGGYSNFNGGFYGSDVNDSLAERLKVHSFVEFWDG